MMRTANRGYILLLLLLMLYVGVLFPFTKEMRHKPFAEKLGYVPQPESVKFAAADQREIIAAGLVMKVLFYFGTLVESSGSKVILPPDYQSMYGILTTALKLDPYNLDAYYFSQAIFVWDVKRVREMNALLEHGMKYRTWDWYLPFWAGFNSAYFLKDYQQAAKYYRRAAELTGSELYTNLTGRYLYEAGQTGLAISYLETMVKGATNPVIKAKYKTRLDAFKNVAIIEHARDAYQHDKGQRPQDVETLVRSGYLSSIPPDPYGGRFYLESDGKVASTSKFTNNVQKNNSN